MAQQDRSPVAVERGDFAEAVESGSARGGRSALRTGPALTAAAVATIVVVGVAVISQLTRHPAGSPAGVPTAADGGSQRPAVQAPPPTAEATSGYPLTFASGTVVGPGAGCCFSDGGRWAGSATGGYPDQTGPVDTSTDPAAWSQWSLGQTTAGHRWDQVKVRVWLPSGRAGAWVRFTVTSTAGADSNVASFDVPEQEYEGWYELPALFTIGSPDQRAGSLWVRMTYLRPYAGPAADAACADGPCRTMAAAQVQFLWS